MRIRPLSASRSSSQLMHSCSRTWRPSRASRFPALPHPLPRRRTLRCLFPALLVLPPCSTATPSLSRGTCRSSLPSSSCSCGPSNSTAVSYDEVPIYSMPPLQTFPSRIQCHHCRWRGSAGLWFAAWCRCLQSIPAGWTCTRRGLGQCRWPAQSPRRPTCRCCCYTCCHHTGWPVVEPRVTSDISIASRVVHSLVVTKSPTPLHSTYHTTQAGWWSTGRFR